MIYLQLFWEYFKVGLFAVGGGPATIPFLTKLSETTGWFTISQLVDMIAVSESTPGPIGINMATYIGYTMKGIPGSIVATAGLVTPSVIIILLIAAALQKFRHSRLVESIFYGIRPASTGLILAALITLCKLCLLNTEAISAGAALGDIFNVKYIILFAILLVLTNIKKIKKLHPIVFIAISAAVGILFSF